MDKTTIIYALLALFFLSATIHRIIHKKVIPAIIFALILALIISNWAGIISILPF